MRRITRKGVANVVSQDNFAFGSSSTPRKAKERSVFNSASADPYLEPLADGERAAPTTRARTNMAPMILERVLNSPPRNWLC